LEASYGLGHRASEGASFMAEEFALKQCTGNRCAIQGHKAILAPRSGLMNCLRDYLFAGACFPLNQDSGVYRRDHVYLVEHSAKSLTRSN
jgi:hypothetical protein